MNYQKTGRYETGELKRYILKGIQVLLDRTLQYLSGFDFFHAKFALHTEKKERLRIFAVNLLRATAGFVFSLAQTGTGVYPFGTALLVSAHEGGLYVLLGTLAASFFYDGYALPYFGLNLITFIVRFGFTSSRMNESMATKQIIALCGGGFLAVLRIVFSPSLMSASLSVIHMAFLCYGVLMFSTPQRDGKISVMTQNTADENVREKKRLGIIPSSTASLYFPWAVATLAMAEYHPFGSSVSFICASLLTMCFSKKYGSLFGGAAGLVFGALSLEAPFVPAALGICGLCIGAFAGKNRYVTPIVYAFCAPVSIIAVAGFGEPCLAFCLDSVVSAVIFVTAMPFVKETAFTVPLALKAKEGAESMTVQNDACRDFDGLSNAFSSLSQIFFRMSDKLKSPPLSEVMSVTETACREFCEGCSAAKKCRVSSVIPKSDTLYKALACGRLTKSELPQSFASGCVSFEKLLYRINSAYKELLSEYFRNNKTEILAAQYSSVAHMIRYTSKNCAERSVPERKTAQKALRTLNDLRIYPQSVKATSGREVVIDADGVMIESVSYGAKELAAALSAGTGILLDVPEFMPVGGFTRMRFRRKRKISLEYAKACHAKTGESVSGDSVSFFESDKDFFYALISDGMGSGREAALTSRLTAVFIEKLLSTGAHKGATLELLNNLLLSKSNECFATVDLLEIDLLEAKASFIKAGAAPAFVVRSAKLYKISSETPPAGIINAFTAENTSFSLCPGDVILLLSDGIIESFDDTPWLAEILGFNAGGDISKLASSILAKARSLNVHDDDMSVVAVRVK